MCGFDGEYYLNPCMAVCTGGTKVQCTGQCPCTACMCTQEDEQVCAMDGKEYGNPCESECAGSQPECKGKCPCPA